MTFLNSHNEDQFSRLGLFWCWLLFYAEELLMFFQHLEILMKSYPRHCVLCSSPRKMMCWSTLGISACLQNCLVLSWISGRLLISLIILNPCHLFLAWGKFFSKPKATISKWAYVVWIIITMYSTVITGHAWFIFAFSTLSYLFCPLTH